ncbi:MAG: helix-turn-helix domain-containing protein [Parabacteroides sp.]|nr:helix-turn-helix domain-containing protein [Parabacteroides sp.]
MKPKDLPFVDIILINEIIGHPHAFPNDLVIETLESKFRNPEDCNEACMNEERDVDNPMSVRINGICFILVTKGSMTVNIDYVKFEIKKNSLFFTLPDHIVEFCSHTPDIEGQILVISKDFLVNSLRPVGDTDDSLQYMFMRKNPSAKLDEDEVKVIDSLFRLIRKRAEVKNHLFHKEAIQSLLFHLFFELKNIIFQKNDIVPVVLSRKEELFQQFLKLLFKHNREQHTVSFYANKLCISPQYLSAILKDLTGKTTNNWIDNSLILDAKVMLKAPNATVQQVSDLLSFANQSTFGKFFKKHAGLSPAEYRRGRQ